MHDVSSLTNY